jgi:hypothetical protein
MEILVFYKKPERQKLEKITAEMSGALLRPSRSSAQLNLLARKK